MKGESAMKLEVTVSEIAEMFKEIQEREQGPQWCR
jgi:hypothetical protein